MISLIAEEYKLVSKLVSRLFDIIIIIDNGPFIYYVSSYNKAGSVVMLTNAYLREQGFIQKLMSYENPH